VQFTDSVDQNGAAIYRTNSASAADVVLEDCSGCGLNGWGWQDNGWGVGVMGRDIIFQNPGPHTIRLQIREDGVSVDQIMLSPSKFLKSAPGALKADTMIYPQAGGQ